MKVEQQIADKKVDQQIANIKDNMKDTYRSIQAKAAMLGKPAFALVRRGLRGEPNCFYAFEHGHVVGTPFNQTNVMPEIARYMVAFGCDAVVVWAGEGQTTTASTAASIDIPTPSTPPIGTPRPETRAGNSTPALAPVAGLGESPLSSPKVAG